MMERFFKLKANNTKVMTEVLAGLTTFFTMAYIIMVNPEILSATGMKWEGVFVATIIATVIGTLIMGLYANVPYAQAPGMGLNAFFTYTVCKGMNFTWQEALTMVFICGLVNMIVTVSKVRKNIVRSIPQSLQYGIGGAIGMFIAYIGIKNAGFLEFTTDPGHWSSTLNYLDGDTFSRAEVASQTVFSDSSIIPALIKFSGDHKMEILALAGLVIMVVLLVKKVKGAIFISIIATTIIGLIFGLVSWPEKIFDLKSVSAVKETSFVMFSKDGFPTLFNSPEKIVLSLVAIFAFSLTDIFDTIGTFIGTGRVSGIFDEDDEKQIEGGKGKSTKMDRALFSDMIATSFGAMLGTSNVTTYVESAAGISVGGRTGLTSVVVAAMFLLCLPFAPLFGMVPSAATAPALIVVGVMMMGSFAKINWPDFEEACPVFFTVVFMSFSYSISYGIAAGFIFYCIIKLLKGKIKEVHPIFVGSAILFLVNFVVLALKA